MDHKKHGVERMKMPKRVAVANKKKPVSMNSAKCVRHKRVPLKK